MPLELQSVHLKIEFYFIEFRYLEIHFEQLL